MERMMQIKKYTGTRGEINNRPMLSRRLFSLGLFAGFAGCSSGSSDSPDSSGSPEPDCPPAPAVNIWGIYLTVYDFRTRAPLGGATAELRDGAYTENLATGDAPLDGKYFMAGAANRPGTYSIKVMRPGYAPWSREGVVVAFENCTWTTAQIEVELIPLN
jgi:hypothetical protein